MAKKKTEPGWLSEMFEPSSTKASKALRDLLNAESARMTAALQDPEKWPEIMAASRRVPLEIRRHEQELGLTRPAAAIGPLEVGSGVEEVFQPRAPGVTQAKAKVVAEAAPIKMMRNDRSEVDDHPYTPACERMGCYAVPDGSRPKRKTWLELMTRGREFIGRIWDRAGTQ